MGLQQTLSSVIPEIKDNSKILKHNEALFNIYEGDLLSYLDAILREQLSAQSYASMKNRLSPINFLRKLVDKLSTIYQQPIIRRVKDGTDTDAELLSWYEQKFDINNKMNGANEFFNLFKNNLLQPYLDRNACPRIRTIPSHQFWPFSTDPIEPNVPTGYIIFMGKHEDQPVFHAYTDEEILIIDDHGKVIPELMNSEGLDGSNPYGKVPFVYTNRSANLLVPKPDSDLLSITLLLPSIMSDLGFISLFQTFSILYGINVKDEGLVFSPNAFWNFSQIDPDAKPELGTLKNEANISDLIDMIKFQLETWISTRGLKASAVTGDDQNISGIAKMIDNIDTSDERNKAVGFFGKTERELWNLVMHYMHPVWSTKPGFETNATFAPKASVETIFAEQVPILTRGDIVDAINKEMEAGFISKRSAMKKLNPTWSDNEIDEELALIDQENVLALPPAVEDFNGDS